MSQLLKKKPYAGIIEHSQNVYYSATVTLMGRHFAELLHKNYITIVTDHYEQFKKCIASGKINVLLFAKEIIRNVCKKLLTI